MSKVIHLSDQAHNNAKNFCKQHGLKMSDWVADLIVDAILNNRVDPRVAPRIPQAAPTTVVLPVASPVSSKKKLEHFSENTNGEVQSEAPEVPPWAAPPFWSKAQNK